MVSGIYWSAGSYSVNEDSIVLEQVQTERGECTLIAVCDGIGSLNHGETASGYVAECLVRWFYRTGIDLGYAGRRRIKRSLNKCAYDAHLELECFAREQGIKWGTTCICICIWKSRYVCMHIGDSGAYVYKGRRMKLPEIIAKMLIPITRAHDMKGTHAGVAKMLIPITHAHVNERGELTKCIGSMGYYRPDITFGRLLRGSGILAASDGFTEKFSDDELASLLDIQGEINSERIERRLAGAGAEAELRGGRDNRSAVYVVRRPEDFLEAMWGIKT